MKYVLILASILAGCRSAERVAADDQIDCVYRVLTNTALTHSEQAELTKGCHSVWKIKTGRF